MCNETILNTVSMWTVNAFGTPKNHEFERMIVTRGPEYGCESDVRDIISTDDLWLPLLYHPCMVYLPTCGYSFFMVNVGKYTSPMDKN